MIARVWKGYADSEKVGAYVEHFEQSVFPELSQIDGYRGATILRRNLADSVEVTVITFWESLDAMRQFAGEQVDTAVVAPAAQAVLRTFDSTVTHYDVLFQK